MLLAALALLVVVALARPAAAQSWPASWRAVPTAEITRETRAAAEDFDVPALLLFALAYVETGKTFATKIRGKKHGGNTARFAASYRTWRHRLIPGSSVRWGEKFTASDWRPYGLMQLMPYHLWGVVLPAAAPLEAAYDVRTNLQAAAKLLRDAYRAGGSWLAAIKTYNAKPLFRDLVVGAYRALGGNPTALGVPRS